MTATAAHSEIINAEDPVITCFHCNTLQVLDSYSIKIDAFGNETYQYYCEPCSKMAMKEPIPSWFFDAIEQSKEQNE